MLQQIKMISLKAIFPQCSGSRSVLKRSPMCDLYHHKSICLLHMQHWTVICKTCLLEPSQCFLDTDPTGTARHDGKVFELAFFITFEHLALSFDGVKQQLIISRALLSPHTAFLFLNFSFILNVCFFYFMADISKY